MEFQYSQKLQSDFSPRSESPQTGFFFISSVQISRFFTISVISIFIN